MIRSIVLSGLLFLGLMPVVFAADLSNLKPAYDGEYDFLAGTYKLVGKRENSDKTYAGAVILSVDRGQLVAKRKIGNAKFVAGIAEIRPLLENGRLLVITYPEGTQPQTVHYMIFTDPDNYPLLAGYAVNEQGRAAENDPGLETLFYDHRATVSGTEAP